MQCGLSETERDWIENVLAENDDAGYVVVAGHYPVFPVNGYREAPMWCFTPEAGEQLWRLLCGHRVSAYLCSHVIAFDVQAHDGILQITSGGAGTVYGPGGFMPGPVEYLHAVQLALDQQGLRYQVLDAHGAVRERLAWPPLEPGTPWETTESVETADLDLTTVLFLSLAETGGVRELRDAGMRPGPYRSEIAWLASDDGSFRLGIDLAADQVVLDLVRDGVGRQRWLGPKVGYHAPIAVDIALHPGMGPGGVLYRYPGQAEWSSMQSASASGLEAFRWPPRITAQSPLLRVRHRRGATFLTPPRHL
jgi:hypothetical protein